MSKKKSKITEKKSCAKSFKVSAQVGRSPPSTVFAEVIAFAETEDLALFNQSNYQVSVSIGLRFSQIHSLSFFFGTGAGQHPTRGDVFDPNYECHTWRREMSDLYSANNSRLKLSGTTMLHLRVDEARPGFLLCVFKQLSVPILPGTSFIDRRIKSIFSGERKAVLHKSLVVPIWMAYDGDGNTDNTHRSKKRQYAYYRRHQDLAFSTLKLPEEFIRSRSLKSLY